MADLEGTRDSAARRYWDEHVAGFGHNLCFAGVAGGYSILNVSVDDGEVGILAGTIPGEGNLSGKALLREFVDRHDWIGDEIYGGSRAIPVRRPFDRLTDGRVITIGDAASQVFPAHGSGIGAGMVAARMLAEVARTLGKMQVAKALYRRYPADPAKLPAWSRAAGLLFGDPPDVTGPLPPRQSRTPSTASQLPS